MCRVAHIVGIQIIILSEHNYTAEACKVLSLYWHERKSMPIRNEEALTDDASVAYSYVLAIPYLYLLCINGHY